MSGSGGEQQSSNLLVLNKAKEMSEWQQNFETVSERDLFLLEKELFTDLTFAVGKFAKKIKCHRLYLAKTSSAFSAMLYGNMYKNHEVFHLPDVHPGAFKAILKYIYCGSIELSEYSYITVCHMLYVAKKYLLPNSLHQQLRKYLCNHVYPDNVWDAIEFASSNDEPQLEEKAWEFLEFETARYLDLDSFLQVRMQTLLALVKRDSLACTEVQLWQACMLWGHTKVEKTGRGEAQLREVVYPVIEHIRFLAMSAQEFVTQVTNRKILYEEEMFPILINLNVKNFKDLPESICKISAARESPNCFFVLGTPYNSKTCTKNASKINENYLLNAHDNTLCGIEIPTQVNKITKNTGCDGSYEEDLTIVMLMYQNPFNKGEPEVISKRVNQMVSYNSKIDVSFEEHILVKNTILSLIAIEVVFHKSGIYPIKSDAILPKENSVWDRSDPNLKFETKFETFLCSVVCKKIK